MYLTSKNLTTNESQKWGQVNKWYKRELKRYNDAVKNGQQTVVVPVQLNDDGGSETAQQSVAISDDGDVTCTPGAGGGPSEEATVDDDDDPNAIRHPGPQPTNLYDRGFVENWKEVIFPISLRNDGSVDWYASFGKAKHS